MALNNPAPLTPEVKQLIADEVRQQVALENIEAQAVARNAEPDAAVSGIHQLLNDGKPHVFVAGHDLDVVDAGGTECGVSEGDALQLSGRTRHTGGDRVGSREKTHPVVEFVQRLEAAAQASRDGVARIGELTVKRWRGA